MKGSTISATSYDHLPGQHNDTRSCLEKIQRVRPHEPEGHTNTQDSAIAFSAKVKGYGQSFTLTCPRPAYCGMASMWQYSRGSSSRRKHHDGGYEQLSGCFNYTCLMHRKQHPLAIFLFVCSKLGVSFFGHATIKMTAQPLSQWSGVFCHCTEAGLDNIRPYNRPSSSDMPSSGSDQILQTKKQIRCQG